MDIGLKMEPHDFRGADRTCTHRYSDGTQCGLMHIQHSEDDGECNYCGASHALGYCGPE